jgi:hypothetical protein
MAFFEMGAHGGQLLAITIITTFSRYLVMQLASQPHTPSWKRVTGCAG